MAVSDSNGPGQVDHVPTRAEIANVTADPSAWYGESPGERQATLALARLDRVEWELARLRAAAQVVVDDGEYYGDGRICVNRPLMVDLAAALEDRDA